MFSYNHESIISFGNKHTDIFMQCIWGEKLQQNLATEPAASELKWK